LTALTDDESVARSQKFGEYIETESHPS
jgi:hypothetical protein